VPRSRNAEKKWKHPTHMLTPRNSVRLRQVYDRVRSPFAQLARIHEVGDSEALLPCSSLRRYNAPPGHGTRGTESGDTQIQYCSTSGLSHLPHPLRRRHHRRVH